MIGKGQSDLFWPCECHCLVDIWCESLPFSLSESDSDEILEIISLPKLSEYAHDMNITTHVDARFRIFAVIQTVISLCKY